MLDSVDLKAVFGDTKTNTLSTTFGESTVTISGRLTTKAGDAVRNAHIKVTAKLSGGGQFDDHNVVTDNDGKFTVPLPRTALAQTVATSTAEQLRERVSASAGQDASWQPFHVVDDQRAALAEDVRRVTSHPLVPERVAVGGFLYDVDTGLLQQLA